MSGGDLVGWRRTRWSTADEQSTFASLVYDTKKKRTRREKFREAVVPWARLMSLIELHYPKAGPKGGRPPMPLEVMLRVYCL